jgi:flagellar motor protein MotB
MSMLQQAMGREQQPGQMPADQQQMVDDPMAMQQQDTGFDEQASPEEQDGYERIVLAAMQILHDEQTNPGIMQMLQQSANDPAQAIATVSKIVLEQIVEKSQGEVPAELVIAAIPEVVGMVVELAEAASLFQADEAVVAKAYQVLIAEAAPALGISAEEIQELMDEFGDQVPGMVEQQNAYAMGGMQQ